MRVEITPSPEIRHGDNVVAILHASGKRMSPDLAAQALASEIASMLREMESMRESVYIPRPSVEDEVSSAAWENAIGELKAMN